jgi:two-component system, chemotaxis family, response regulator Rcp1
MMNYSNKSVEVLIIEDNEGDIRLIKEAFKDSKIVNKFSVVSDGQQALDFLNKSGEFESSVRPDIILLDLNLPKINGFDVLREVKSNPALQKIPVIIFSRSASDNDVLRSYNLNANSFVSKPADLEEFLNVVKTIGEFWLQTVKLPVN